MKRLKFWALLFTLIPVFATVVFALIQSGIFVDIFPILTAEYNMDFFYDVFEGMSNSFFMLFVILTVFGFFALCLNIKVIKKGGFSFSTLLLLLLSFIELSYGGHPFIVEVYDGIWEFFVNL